MVCLQVHLEILVTNNWDLGQDFWPSFVLSSIRVEWFCNTLSTAGIYKMEPVEGKVLLNAEQVQRSTMGLLKRHVAPRG